MCVPVKLVISDELSISLHVPSMCAKFESYHLMIETDYILLKSSCILHEQRERGESLDREGRKGNLCFKLFL